MKKIAFILLTLLVLSLPALAEQKDHSGCKDHPLFPTRMSNFRIEACDTKDFGAFEFFTDKGPKRAVEGKITSITYAVDERKNDRTPLEVVRNYENALKKVGGTIQSSNPQRWVNGYVVADGKETWFQAEKGNGKIWLKIVEKQAMAQTIVADAASFKNDLKTTGHTAVYGIYFDTGKWEVKPESTQAIGEIAKLLKADPGLKLYVVGHTDTVGNVENNLKLSQERAKSVIQALVRDHGIAAVRLHSFGNGPFAPVASNDSEDGRAKNRRVELVKQ